jgi:hypothetical protein
MAPLVVKEFIKKVIDDKIKNLHPDVEKMIIEEVLRTGFDKEYKIKYFIRERLKLPKVGSDKKLYWEKRGWSKEEIETKRIIKKMPSSPMKIDNWLNKINEKTGELYTKEEANYKIKSFRKLNSEYWLERGFSEEDSLNKVKEYQKENSDKFVKKILENPENYTDRTETQLNYWIKKGYDLDNSREKLKQRQDTTSIEFHHKRYGEEDGSVRYNKRITNIAYNSSRKFYVDKYGIIEGNKLYDVILHKRIVPICRASKESFYFLKNIYKYLRKNGIEKSDIYWGVGHSNEWFINKGSNLFFYDFTVPKLNIIIEYHGKMFHPNPEKVSDKESWKCLYSGLPYDIVLKNDLIKKQIAIDKGYEYLVVYSDDNLHLKINEIIKKIGKKINE